MTKIATHEQMNKIEWDNNQDQQDKIVLVNLVQ